MFSLPAASPVRSSFPSLSLATSCMQSTSAAMLVSPVVPSELGAHPAQPALSRKRSRSSSPCSPTQRKRPSPLPLTPPTPEHRQREWRQLPAPLQLSHAQLRALHLHLARPDESEPEEEPSFLPSPPPSPTFDSRIGPAAQEQNLADYDVPSTRPPINSDTLAELGFSRMMADPKLRHGIALDDGMRFRPDFDGEGGPLKKMKEERYFLALAREFDTGCRCTTFPSSLSLSDGSSIVALPCICAIRVAACEHDRLVEVRDRLPSRVDAALNEVASVVGGLLDASASCEPVPEELDVWRSRTDVQSALAPLLVGQEGFDFLALAETFGKTMKLHCAPARDSWVDSVALLLRQGRGWEATALRQVLTLCEGMRLDILNHQLVQLRPTLLHGAEKNIRRSISHTHGFLSSNLGGHSADWARRHCSEETMRNSFVSDMVCGGALPETLDMDGARIGIFKADVVDLVAVALLSHGLAPVPSSPQADLWDAYQGATGVMSTLAGGSASIPSPSRALAAAHTEEKAQSGAWHGAVRRLLVNRGGSAAWWTQNGQADARLWQLLERGVEACLLASLSGMGEQELHQLVRRSGLGAVEHELYTLTARVGRLWAWHWQVWGRRYERTWQGR